MKISLKWLSDYIDVQDYFTKTAELSALLTAAGLEVESVQNLAKTYEHVVVGHILKKDQHPNADRLSLCQVSTGEGRVHQIVCGARNHAEGDNVVVALPGAVLPGDFAIKHSKIRGVESGGMLCSLKELGLEGDSDGIVILPKDAPVGAAFAKYMGFDDILLELKVTPNRADCLSHFGLAREIGCLLDREVKFPTESFVEEGGSTREQVGLELRASDLCPRYAGRGVKGVKIGPSPEWLKKRLEAVGLASINNVVDVTNFVMMELGQPLHAFDVRQIKGRKLIIDRAIAGEVFVSLDGTELTLDGSELTIRDTERPVALAGIVGGQNSGIQDDTTDIFIEAAYFTPSAVRRTSRKFGFETDSSYRFSRGTNPEAVLLALSRAAQLIQQVAGGKIMTDAFDEYPSPLKHEPIAISIGTLVERLGYKIEPEQFIKWMTRLGCELKSLGEGTRGMEWAVLPPLFRWDLTLDVDLIEEFARLHGYQHIPERLPPLATMPAVHDPQFVLETKIRRLLQAEGALQAVNYGFIGRSFQEKILGDAVRSLGQTQGQAPGQTSGPKQVDSHGLQSFGLRASGEPVALINPLNEEINVMRLSLVPGLVKNVVHNSRHGNSFGRLFEIGHAHFVEKMEEGRRYPQEARLGFAYWGHDSGLWSKAESSPVVFALKGAIENLLRGLNITRWKWVQDRKASSTLEFLHPGQTARLEVEGRAVGLIGTLHPALAADLKIRESCALGEINLDTLCSGAAALIAKAPKYQPISKMPQVERDLAFVMPKDLPVAEVEAEMRKAAGELLRDVRVFDVFEGGGLESGQRSVAYRLVFQAREATLEDAAINEVRDRVVAAVSSKFAQFAVALRT